MDVIEFKNGRWELSNIEYPNLDAVVIKPMLSEDWKTAMSRNQGLLPIGVYPIQRIYKNLYGTYATVIGPYGYSFQIRTIDLHVQRPVKKNSEVSNGK